MTGEIRVSRFLWWSFDCGRILNPKTAASQVRGGIIMGLGLAGAAVANAIYNATVRRVLELPITLDKLL